MVQMGGVRVHFAWMRFFKNCSLDDRRDSTVKKSKGVIFPPFFFFLQAYVNDAMPQLLIDWSFSTPFHRLMVSITTTCTYCVKGCPSITKQHMAAP